MNLHAKASLYSMEPRARILCVRPWKSGAESQRPSPPFLPLTQGELLFLCRFGLSDACMPLRARARVCVCERVCPVKVGGAYIVLSTKKVTLATEVSLFSNNGPLTRYHNALEINRLQSQMCWNGSLRVLVDPYHKPDISTVWWISLTCQFIASAEVSSLNPPPPPPYREHRALGSGPSVHPSSGPQCGLLSRISNTSMPLNSGTNWRSLADPWSGIPSYLSNPQRHHLKIN